MHLEPDHTTRKPIPKENSAPVLIQIHRRTNLAKHGHTHDVAPTGLPKANLLSYPRIYV